MLRGGPALDGKTSILAISKRSSGKVVGEREIEQRKARARVAKRCLTWAVAVALFHRAQPLANMVQVAEREDEKYPGVPVRGDPVKEKALRWKFRALFFAGGRTQITSGGDALVSQENPLMQANSASKPKYQMIR